MPSWFFIVIGLIVAACGFAVGLRFLLKDARGYRGKLDRCIETGMATILSRQKNFYAYGDGTGVTSFTYQFEISDETGKVFRVNTGPQPWNFGRIGNRIFVKFNPDEPSEIATWKDRAAYIAFMILAGAFLFLGVFGLWMVFGIKI